ncbi:MAG: DUF6542 domain-containing protein [Nocardioidaceae bacterium]
MSTGRAHPSRTLWEEGRKPGRRVALVASVASLAVIAVDLVITHHITLWYDVAFLAICVGAALGVRPRDFFVVGVFPPLLMAGTMLAVALVDRSAVADKGDGIIQGVISGLAHHSTALVIGYALTLMILALRRVALRNAGALRAHPR